MHRSDHRIEERLSTIFHFYGLKKLFKTPRDVQRVLNKVCVIEPSLRGDVNLADLIAFSAIEHKCPSFVAWIEGVRIASGFDAQPIFRDLNDKGSSFQSQFDVFKSSLPTADKEVISRLVTFLFPQLSVVPDSSNNQDLVAGHIGHPKVLNIALRHFTFDGAIRPSVANAFLNATKASEQSAILDEIESWEEMESFLDIVNGETFRLDEAERAAAAIAFAQAFGRVPAPKTFDAELFLPRIVWSGEQERPGLAKNFSDIDAVFDHHLCVDYSTLLLWWNANIVSDEERRFKPFAEGASIVALRRKICVHVQSSILNGTFLGSYKQINRLVWILREEPKLLGDLTKWISQSDDRRNDFLEKSEPEFNASSSTGGPYFHFYQNYWDLIGGYETWKVFAERRLSQKDSNLSNMQRLRFVGIRDAAPP